MVKVYLYYGFDPKDTGYTVARISSFKDKKAVNLARDIAYNAFVFKRENSKEEYGEIVKYINSLAKDTTADFKYSFKMIPDFFIWTRNFKDFFKEHGIHIIFVYSETFGARLVSEWRKKQLAEKEKNKE